MQIIVLHPREQRMLRFHLTRLRVALLMLALCSLVAAAASGVTWLVARSQASPEVSRQARENAFLRQNLAVLAASVGDLQAQMVRLDALGERVSGLAGIAPRISTFAIAQPVGPGRAGAVDRTDLPELRAELARLGEQAEHRVDYFDVIETALMDRQMRERRIPGCFRGNRVRRIQLRYADRSFHRSPLPA
jgi:hypothetical protein